MNKIHDLNKGVLYSQSYFNGTATREVKRIVHVHGELNRNMLMGVNDASQLPFLENLPDKIKRRLIKPEKNKDIGYNIDKQADEIIRNSVYMVCQLEQPILFGGRKWEVGCFLEPVDTTGKICYNRDYEDNKRTVQTD